MAFSLEGYRRFVEKTSVKLHGDLVAFVGPNEAGKSSLLRALAHLGSDGGFEANERSRRTHVEPKLAWHFQLEADDRAALAGIHDSGRVERAIVGKQSDGTHTWRFEPHQPRRDRTRRHKVAELLRSHRDHDQLQFANDDDGSEFNLGDFDRVIETLEADVADYEGSNIDGLRDVARRISTVTFPPYDAGVDEDADTHDGETEAASHAAATEAWEAKRDSMASAIEEVAAEEAAPSPWRLAVDALQPRLPRILLFSEDDRALASEYELEDVADEPPAGLDHLATLAGLDLKALRDEATSQAVADVATRRNAANRRLLEAFEQSWNQQGIAVQVEVQGTILHIQATTPEDSGLSSIGERSDGMRWFAALLAYAHGWDDQPILLVDEIERHLHYDAQSDLVEVLAKQAFTSKVIYTTHSFGCLPHDLGTGVRVVQPIDTATSRLENGFWRRGSGFSPLLASMGAAAMSFTPTRHALIAEGAADAILLPTLLRQASGEERLGFQVAPGLSSVAASSVAELEAEAGRVAFLVDGDKGGSNIVAKLTAAGIPVHRVMTLTDSTTGEGLEVEDLVAPSVYAQAANDELRCWQEIDTEMTVDDFGAAMRTKAVEAWCASEGVEAPDKAAVAQRVVDASTDESIVAPTRQDVLRSLLAETRSALGLP